MKNLMKLALVAIVATFFAACGGSDKPEAVAEKFLNHLNKKEFAEAKKLGTEATGQMLDMMESFSKMGGNATEEKPKTLKDFKAEVNGDAAVVTYKADDKEEKLNLVKKDGKWLVDMKKEMGQPTEPTTTEAQADTTAKQ